VGWKLAEAELQHWAIGTGNVYLLLLLQLLENKVIINLTCSEFVEGQEVIKLYDWFLYFLISFSLQESNSLVKRPFSSH
jgi:MAternally-affected-uncoordination protein